MLRRLLLLVLFSQIILANAQITRIKIDRSSDTTGEVVMRLAHRFQSYNWTPSTKYSHYDTEINSEVLEVCFGRVQILRSSHKRDIYLNHAAESRS